MQDTMYNPALQDPNRQKTLQRVPLGYDDLEANNFSSIPLARVLKMIKGYSAKPADAKPEPDGTPQPGPAAAKTLGCWFCVDVFLKLMGIDATEEQLKKKGMMDPDVSGVRIYFARSGDCDTVVMLTTEREPAPNLQLTKGYESTETGEPAAPAVRNDLDRIGPWQRVVYVDKDHQHPDGGSMCPPPNTNTLEAVAAS
jgi:hypothetical protein